MTKDEYIRSLSFWTIALQYLALVENAVREIVSQGNACFLMTDYKDGERTIENHLEQTRWSDHTLIVPLLFDLYHGLELLAKGFLLARKPEEVEAHHGIQELIRQFIQIFPDENTLGVCFEKYTTADRLPPLIKEFLVDNHIEFGRLYECLRYPTDRSFNNSKRYGELKYRGTNGLPFFQELLEDIKILRIAAVCLGSKIVQELGEQPQTTPQAMP